MKLIYTFGETKLKTLYFSHISSVHNQSMHMIHAQCNMNLYFVSHFSYTVGNMQKGNIREKTN